MPDIVDIVVNKAFKFAIRPTPITPTNSEIIFIRIIAKIITNMEDEPIIEVDFKI